MLTRDPHCAAVATQALLDALDYVGYCYSTERPFSPRPSIRSATWEETSSGAGFCEWDASIIKTWRIKERFRLQVRGEVFNLANHGNYSAGSVGEDLSDFSSLGRASATPDVYASNPVVGSGGARHIQLGAKIIW